MQLEYLGKVIECRNAMVWGRNPKAVDRYVQDMTAAGFSVERADDPGDVAATCNLIVTTTPTLEPLLTVEQIRPGTHISAVGSDTPEKQEVDAAILGRAELVVADSISQCILRGEISQALRAGTLAQDNIVELGQIIAGSSPGRTAEDHITIADLTGVAVQDIRIAVAVCKGLETAEG